ncbi:MAG: GIY-YIG nuclease family protein [Elusimicrobiaceae bacterium]|nr:GIY-YIG nuclease family protein [Elusimicrobiaceae bacterium]
MNACVYILTNHTNTVLYIGVTSNLERRIYEHKSGLLPGFSKRYKLCKLVHCESCSSILDAIRREKQLKSWRRSWKEELINRVNPQWKDLSTK